MMKISLKMKLENQGTNYKLENELNLTKINWRTNFIN